MGHRGKSEWETVENVDKEKGVDGVWGGGILRVRGRLIRSRWGKPFPENQTEGRGRVQRREGAHDLGMGGTKKPGDCTTVKKKTWKIT